MTNQGKGPVVDLRFIERLMAGIFILIAILVIVGVIQQRIDITAVALGLVTALGGLTTYYLQQRRNDEDEKP